MKCSRTGLRSNLLLDKICPIFDQIHFKFTILSSLIEREIHQLRSPWPKLVLFGTRPSFNNESIEIRTLVSSTQQSIVLQFWLLSCHRRYAFPGEETYNSSISVLLITKFIENQTSKTFFLGKRKRRTQTVRPNKSFIRKDTAQHFNERIVAVFRSNILFYCPIQQVYQDVDLCLK